MSAYTKQESWRARNEFFRFGKHTKEYMKWVFKNSRRRYKHDTSEIPEIEGLTDEDSALMRAANGDIDWTYFNQGVVEPLKGQLRDIETEIERSYAGGDAYGAQGGKSSGAARAAKAKAGTKYMEQVGQLRHQEYNQMLERGMQAAGILADVHMQNASNVAAREDRRVAEEGQLIRQQLAGRSELANIWAEGAIQDDKFSRELAEQQRQFNESLGFEREQFGFLRQQQRESDRFAQELMNKLDRETASGGSSGGSSGSLSNNQDSWKKGLIPRGDGTWYDMQSGRSYDSEGNQYATIGY